MLLGHYSLRTYCFICKISSSQTLSEDSSPLRLTWSFHVFFTPLRVPSHSCSWHVISEQVWLSLKLVISKKCQKSQVIIMYIISTVQYVLLSQLLKQTNPHSDCSYCMSNKEKPPLHYSVFASPTSIKKACFEFIILTLIIFLQNLHLCLTFENFHDQSPQLSPCYWFGNFDLPASIIHFSFDKKQKKPCLIG